MTETAKGWIEEADRIAELAESQPVLAGRAQVAAQCAIAQAIIDLTAAIREGQ